MALQSLCHCKEPHRGCVSGHCNSNNKYRHEAPSVEHTKSALNRSHCFNTTFLRFHMLGSRVPNGLCKHCVVTSKAARSPAFYRVSVWTVIASIPFGHHLLKRLTLGSCTHLWLVARCVRQHRPDLLSLISCTLFPFADDVDGRQPLLIL